MLLTLTIFTILLSLRFLVFELFSKLHFESIDLIQNRLQLYESCRHATVDSQLKAASRPVRIARR